MPSRSLQLVIFFVLALTYTTHVLGEQHVAPNSEQPDEIDVSYPVGDMPRRLGSDKKEIKVFSEKTNKTELVKLVEPTNDKAKEIEDVNDGGEKELKGAHTASLIGGSCSFGMYKCGSKCLPYRRQCCSNPRYYCSSSSKQCVYDSYDRKYICVPPSWTQCGNGNWVAHSRQCCPHGRGHCNSPSDKCAWEPWSFRYVCVRYSFISCRYGSSGRWCYKGPNPKCCHHYCIAGNEQCCAEGGYCRAGYRCCHSGTRCCRFGGIFG